MTSGDLPQNCGCGVGSVNCVILVLFAIKLYICNMKKLICLVTSCFLIYIAVGQKTPISFTSFQDWAEIERVAISDDGSTVWYYVENDPVGSRTMIIKNLKSGWEKRYTGAKDATFSNDGRGLTIKQANDSLCVVNLNTGKEAPFVPSRQQNDERKELLPKLSVTRAEATGVIITNLEKQVSDTISNVVDYIVSNREDALLLKLSKVGDEKKSTLIYYDVNNRSRRTIIDEIDTESLTLLPPAEKSNLMLFKIKVNAHDQYISEYAHPKIWSFMDRIDPAPFSTTETGATYAVYNKTELRVICVKGPEEQILDINDSLVLIKEPAKCIPEEEAQCGAYTVTLLRLSDGTRKRIIEFEKDYPIYAQFSPTASHVILPLIKELKYLSYNINTEQLSDLSKDLKIYRTLEDYDFKVVPFSLNWISGSEFYISGENDIWKLDITGKERPVNLTAFYGERNQLQFSFPKTDLRDKYRYLTKTSGIDGYLLYAFDKKTKFWGFYTLKDLTGRMPVKKMMGPVYFRGFDPYLQKAKNSNTYVLLMESVSQSPNVYVTKDFVDFKRMSNISPETKFNWIKSELVSWTNAAGRKMDGIVYTPEDINKSQKYPLVVMVYNEFTPKLYRYPNYQIDELGGQNILPVTWLVSNGYVVFIPDVTRREAGKPLEYSFDIVMTGLKKVSELPYIDTSKIGIQGASWGGEQVNYIITHTTRFAAAYTGAGFSERISGSGFTDVYVEWPFFGPIRRQLGGMLTEKPENYITQSSLFCADKVTTPLLIRHCRDDDAVPFYQGFQFFTLLSKLKKKVWLLEYDKGGHGVGAGGNNIDMHMRLAGFFDHYLKGKEKPGWLVPDQNFNQTGKIKFAETANAVN
jgi:dienelactone hydrolase